MKDDAGMQKAALEEDEDEKLVAMVREGDRDAEESLLKKYSPLVKKETRFLFLVGAEEEDLIQEGMIGLVKAIRTFQNGRGAVFSTFAKICIRGQLRSAVTAASRKKHFPLSSYISIYTDNKEDSSLLDSLGGETVVNPEEMMMRQEQQKEMYGILDGCLSVFEKKVVKYYLEGMSCSEIGQILGKNEKSIQNAIARIRMKVREDQKRHETE